MLERQPVDVLDEPALGREDAAIDVDMTGRLPFDVVDSEPEAVRMGTSTGRAVIAAAVLGSGMAFLDGTVVNVALQDHRRRTSTRASPSCSG